MLYLKRYQSRYDPTNGRQVFSIGHTSVHFLVLHPFVCFLENEFEIILVQMEITCANTLDALPPVVGYASFQPPESLMIYHTIKVSQSIRHKVRTSQLHIPCNVILLMERVESRVISNAFKKLSFHIWIYLFLVVIVAVYVRVGRTHRVSIPICHLFDFFGVFVRFQVLFFEYLLELIDVLFYRWNRKCLIQINAHKYAQGQPEHLSGNQMFKYPILVVGTLSPRRGPS